MVVRFGKVIRVRLMLYIVCCIGGSQKKSLHGCSSKTCSEVVRGDMGLETLKSCRDKAKLKWWYVQVSNNASRIGTLNSYSARSGM